ncbi:hypothetical protein HK101_000516 [Irineochytrium annulatum]|nr:hypothetical protein HK101_000516 [Irineochytrium annulatum]
MSASPGLEGLGSISMPIPTRALIGGPSSKRTTAFGLGPDLFDPDSISGSLTGLHNEPRFQVRASHRRPASNPRLHSKSAPVLIAGPDILPRLIRRYPRCIRHRSLIRRETRQLMKFSKQLLLRAIPAWREHYIDFKALKGTIKVFVEEKLAAIPEDQRSEAAAVMMKDFTADLKKEAEKVNSWYQVKEDEGKDRLLLLSKPWTPDATDEQKEKWIEDLSDLIGMLENLLDFSKTNLAGFKKIMKKFDKHMKVKMTRELWAVVADFRFAKSEMDEMMLSEAKQLWRKRIPPISLEPTDDLPLLDQEDIPTMAYLDLQALPGGTVSRMWVALAEDGLNNPIRVPVIVAKGVKAGPVVGITAALHGNELNGIPLIHRLIRELNCKALHGTLVAIPVTNAPGYLRSQRGYSEGTDLNRILPGKSDGSAPQVYAYALMDRLIKNLDYLLDLHTASRGRVNSLYVRADMLNPRTRKMASLQNPQIIVHNKSPDGSLRGATMDKGIAAITVEIGDPSRFQKRFVKNALLGVTNILCHLKMIPSEPDLPEYEPVICSRSFWIFADKGGVLSVLPEIYTWVRKGEPIAYVHSLFGGVIRTYNAPEDGIVIGKSVDPVCESGSRILHLGVVEETFAKDANDGRKSDLRILLALFVER